MPNSSKGEQRLELRMLQDYILKVHKSSEPTSPVGELFSDFESMMASPVNFFLYGVMSPSLLRGASGGQIDWITTFELWLPAAGLLASLVLQIAMLITGQLRRRVPAAAPFGWAAYVFSDQVAAFTLGLLSQAEEHVGLYGLWATLLVYHLGGPDNFTAYERADSELWMRHLANLVIQVGTSGYVLWVDSRGWILIPTLLLFLVGFFRYWERNVALQRSSRAGITKAMTALYKYMENDGEPSPTGSLNYIVGGAGHWYLGLKGRFTWEESYQNAKPYLVTTADIEQELSLSDPTVREWAQWLVVASASSSAYLRRVVGLARQEQNTTQRGATRLRSLWFEKHLKLDQWMEYMQIEQDFLYNLLYTKPPNPDGNPLIFSFRILSTCALLLSLVAVYCLANYDTWQENEIYEVVTYVVLVVGAVVEIGYVVRLFFSKAAIVAMLVHLVKARRANVKRAARLELICGGLMYSILEFVCVWLLTVNKWWETTVVISNKTYIPGSNWEKGLNVRRSIVNRFEAYLPGFVSSKWERGWEMVRMATPEGRDCTTLLNKIEACQTVGVMSLLKRIQALTELQPGKNRMNQRLRLDTFPQEPALQRAFWDFYNSDWEHVLLIWWIATLKVLCLQERSLMIGMAIEHNYEHDKLLMVAQMNPHNGLVNGSRTMQEEREELLPETTASPDPNPEYEGSQAQANPANGCNMPDEHERLLRMTTGYPTPEHADVQAEANRVNAESTQMEALWLMVYICHLLTSSPELLPTHLDLTKRLVAQNLAIAREDIRDPFEWVEGTRLHEVSAINTSDVQVASSQLALKLMMNWNVVERWQNVKISACHFIAILAQTGKLDEHCSKLTRGGELLTTLWILSSHLGGGQQS